MNELKVKIKKLDLNAKIPEYAKNGDAGLDLVCISKSMIDTQITYGIGLAVEIPEGHCGLVLPRSSIHKYDLVLSNSCGLIDSGYRGEIKAIFNTTKGGQASAWHSKIYEIGDKVAQLVIIPYPKVKFEEVEELSDSERGLAGFGHSGT